MVAATVRDAEILRPSADHTNFPDVLDLRTYTGIVELAAADQVVTVRVGTPVAELLDELAPYGLTLPLGVAPRLSDTVGGAMALGFPHADEGRVGGWRDWVLETRFVLADGTEARSGAKVVKSVAGYDLHRYLVGTRHLLAVPFEVTLRLAPGRARVVSPPARGLARLPLSSLLAFLERVEAVAVDPLSGYVWTAEPVAAPEGWSVDLAAALPRSARTDKLKALMDPTGKLNPERL